MGNLTVARDNKAALALRPAGAADSDLLLGWTNQQRTCGLGLSGSEPVERATHDAWLAERLSDPDCRIRIIEHVGKPAGMVRLEREAGSSPETVTVSIFIARDARRLGIASAAIERALRDTVRERGALTAVARVRLENAASRRLFDSLGFTLSDRYADHVVLRRRMTA